MHIGAQVTLSFGASAEQLPVKVYTEADGLAQRWVRRIIRDSQGFLWLCAGEWLNPYGQRIKPLGTNTSASRRDVRSSGPAGNSMVSVRLGKGKGEGCSYLDGFVRNDNDP
jgi:hypothetical protein